VKNVFVFVTSLSSSVLVLAYCVIVLLAHLLTICDVGCAHCLSCLSCVGGWAAGSGASSVAGGADGMEEGEDTLAWQFSHDSQI
jgi:hypothetical protein